ncbi:hypothetical protein IQ07DRAFT_645975, partial [Pyrenochaeta sp. DS3sAY3a]
KQEEEQKQKQEEEQKQKQEEEQKQKQEEEQQQQEQDSDDEEEDIDEQPSQDTPPVTPLPAEQQKEPAPVVEHPAGFLSTASVEILPASKIIEEALRNAGVTRPQVGAKRMRRGMKTVYV